MYCEDTCFRKYLHSDWQLTCRQSTGWTVLLNSEKATGLTQVNTSKNVLYDSFTGLQRWLYDNNPGDNYDDDASAICSNWTGIDLLA